MFTSRFQSASYKSAIFKFNSIGTSSYYKAFHAKFRKLRVMANDVSGLRKQYCNESNIFCAKNLKVLEPYAQFQDWFQEALKTETIEEPNAMALATATRNDVPSVRIVLMKSFDKRGFLFYTNYGSRKGTDLISNPNCSLMFYWEPLKRSVRIQGEAVRLSDEESTTYFNSRPRANQVAAVVSKQSCRIVDRASLDEEYRQMLEHFSEENVTISRPEYWGGFRVIASSFEFWQGQTNRLHDRLLFRRPPPGELLNPDLTEEVNDGWWLERLSP